MESTSQHGESKRRNRRDVEYTELPAIGNAIETESKSYDRIFGMLLGIRVHVSRLVARGDIPLENHHFNEYEKIDIPREGNHYAPAHEGNFDYKFKSYSPVVFLHLRHFFGISDEEYLVSLTADYMMSELKTIGRSSAMFYYTWDGQYVIKTLTKNEMAVLRKILPKYYNYVTLHPDSLVNQFFGAYRSQTSVGKPIRFVVMNNVFPIGFNINYKFDLKGSVINRSVSEEKRRHPGSTWKEAEFQMQRYLHVGPSDWALLKQQLLNDTNFFSSVGVMDYSLLVGIHLFNADSPIMNPGLGERIELFSVFTADVSFTSRYNGNKITIRQRQLKGGKRHKRKPVGKDEQTQFATTTITSATLPYRADDSQRLLSFCGGLRGSSDIDEPLNEVYFMGFIDFLQNYSARKGAEHFFKSIAYKHDEMSCIPPRRYAERMFNFLQKCIEPPAELTPVEQQRLLGRRETMTFMRRGSINLQNHPPSIMLESPKKDENQEKETKEKHHKGHKHRKHQKKEKEEKPQKEDNGKEEKEETPKEEAPKEETNEKEEKPQEKNNEEKEEKPQEEKNEE